MKNEKTKIAKTFPIFKFDTAMESSEYVQGVKKFVGHFATSIQICWSNEIFNFLAPINRVWNKVQVKEKNV